MITNLVAAVTTMLVTNTTEMVTAWDHQEPAPCPEHLSGCLVMHWKGVGPREKDIVTEVKEVSTISFDYLGQHVETKVEKVISSSVRHLVVMWGETSPGIVIPPTNQFFYLNMDPKWSTNVLTNPNQLVK